MNNLFKTISTRRSIRKYDANKTVETEILKKIVKLGALAPSRLNRQPWQFIIINEEKVKTEIFTNILWGSKNSINKIFANTTYSPNCYIAILIDEKITNTGFEYEIGACVENMMVYAWGLGIGSVWLHSLNRENIVSLLKIPAEIKLDSLIAFGYPDQTSNTIETKDSCQYTIDEKVNLIVPKRNINDITFFNQYGCNKKT